MYARRVRGAVAAGDRSTAEAAAGILRRGGNAVDAAIAGAFASFVAEPLLAGAGGAGMMTVALPGHAPAVVDFFPSMPGLGGRADALDFFEVEIDFGPAMQRFHVGRGSVAPPLALPGLAEAARRFARLPLAELVEPAVRMAREGVPLGAAGAHVYAVLWPIQCITPEATALAGGAPPREGSLLGNPALADLLEETAAVGDTPPRFTRAMLEALGPAAGGLVSEADLACGPRVVAPREVQLGDWSAFTSPRVGGGLAQIILERLFAEPPSPDPATEAARVAAASRAGHEARFAAGRGSTTHVSVIDCDGGAAAVTLTNGEGCGTVIPDTGVQMNNFLGEEDLNPAGFHRHPPGTPLPTMIAPTIGLHRGRPALALGSGGSNRIRSVVSQVLYRVVRGEPLEHAVLAPRIHAERDDVWIELADRADPDATVARLGESFARVHPFAARAFYFGGVHAVLLDEDGRAHAVGDPRRDGAVAFGV